MTLSQFSPSCKITSPSFSFLDIPMHKIPLSIKVNGLPISAPIPWPEGWAVVKDSYLRSWSQSHLNHMVWELKRGSVYHKVVKGYWVASKQRDALNTASREHGKYLAFIFIMNLLCFGTYSYCLVFFIAFRLRNLSSLSHFLIIKSRFLIFLGLHSLVQKNIAFKPYL